MLNTTARRIIAALQIILGWEWLMSGFNKLFSGSFPQGLAGALNDAIKGNPNGWYVAFLQGVVLPDSVFFGYLIQWTEISIGIILLGGAALLLTKPRLPGEPQYGLPMAYYTLVVGAAVVATFLCINFHFLMGGWVIPTIRPDGAYDEGIDLDALMPLFSLVIIFANLALIQALSGKQWFKLTKPTSPEQKVVVTAPTQQAV
jgi:thiosulfate dehydrogenase [quinone] large subunit